MGEWSKKIGEYGENVVRRFLNVIGWTDPIQGIDIKCAFRHLNDERKVRETHGLDYIYSYDCPLVQGRINNVVMSVKYKTEKYPGSPTKQFKEYLNALFESLECFEYDEQRDKLLNNRNHTSVNDCGILFWLNNQEDSEDDLISVVSSARIEQFARKTIYIMDNKRVAFIIAIIAYIKNQQDYNYGFFYPYTGQNINPQTRKNYGQVLPIEYINSSIIPIRLEHKRDGKDIRLFLGLIDNFDEDVLLRVIGLAKDLSASFAAKIIIGFPDYNALVHEAQVNTVKFSFSDSEFTQNVIVVNYNDILNVF